VTPNNDYTVRIRREIRTGSFCIRSPVLFSHSGATSFLYRSCACAIGARLGPFVSRIRTIRVSVTIANDLNMGRWADQWCCQGFLPDSSSCEAAKRRKVIQPDVSSSTFELESGDSILNSTVEISEMSPGITLSYLAIRRSSSPPSVNGRRIAVSFSDFLRIVEECFAGESSSFGNFDRIQSHGACTMT
jgi:hypothetical protein